MRVAFSVFGGDGWTGGINYLRNLLSAIHESPALGIEAILFIAPETSLDSIAALTPYLVQPPVVVAGWSSQRSARIKRLLGSALLQNDYVSLSAFREEKIDVVFQHAAWYGLRFPIPMLAWIADFQHKHLKHMFSTSNNLKRDLGYWALSLCATRVMVSSQDAGKDCAHFFPRFRGRISTVPFAVQISDNLLEMHPSVVIEKYQLPQQYLYMPNQFWRHKNHLNLIEALKLLKTKRPEIVVVVSGNPKDVRNPEHPQHVFDKVAAYGLEHTFRFLGLVPYEHIMPLMRGALAVVNPSLFEGWSTPVEEAKALGVPLVLSNLGVHIEQAPHESVFFDPLQPSHIAEALEMAWKKNATLNRTMLEESAITAYKEKRRVFAQDFAQALQLTIDQKRI